MPRKKQSPSPSPSPSGSPLDALAKIIMESIQPGGGAYEAARRELSGNGDKPPDARPIKEIVALYAALQDAQAKEAERDDGREIKITFEGVAKEVAEAWAE